MSVVTDELAAQVIRKTFYGDKNDNELTEAEKQNISALAQLATGLAIAVAGGNVGDAGTAIAAGKNAVENNYLCVEATCKLRPGEMTMTGGGGAIVGGALVGSAILAEETGALDGVKDSFNEWLTTGRDGALIKDDGSSNNEPEINNPVTGSVIGGAPGLPPDDDHNNKDKSSASEDKSQTTSNGYKVSNGADKVIDKADLENPIVQSRINIQNGSINDNKGWSHVVARHFYGNSNASQFTISEEEAKTIIGSNQVRNVPISNTRISTIKGTNVEQKIYERVITLDKNIGVDKFTGRPTNTITILTDRSGNLITATPGRILP
ncbi:VENN motif pre-toxin domain-containing protein [Gilliamella sp. wkB292]|uniref:VENN motif pre-toxin domain-containing protein n=1 Tax=Gilliamella sp. wkB292 TaxID=3120262 RepID=UPI00080D910C|nr:VENN motif pre-toxin domain-containing protein [Gilliamella apicola]